MELVPLPWDSELFGFSIARIDGRPDASLLTEMAGKSGIRCAYHFCPAGDVDRIRSAEQSGFHLVDIRVVLEAGLGEISPGRSDTPVTEVAVDLVRPDDLDDLREMAAELSTHSRFAFDPGFGAVQARRLYNRWVEVSLEGRANLFVVARANGRAIGFVTSRTDDAVASLELVAVRNSARGAGVGNAMMKRLRRNLQEGGHRQVKVVTQGRNTAAMRFYEQCGFGVAKVSLVYHRWFDLEDPR